MNELTHPEFPRVDLRACSSRWVALNPQSHSVVASGATLKDARAAAIKLGVERPLLMMVPESKGYFVGLP